MKLIEQAEYQYWAEKKFFELVEKISDDNWKTKLPEFSKSLREVYIHKYEVMFFWFTLIYTKDSKEVNKNPLYIPDFDELNNKEEFAIEALKLFERVINYIKIKANEKITLKIEWISKPYEITTHEILYNIFNHLTYHRGQTAFILKKLGLEIPETDYNPFMYETRQLY